MRLFASSLIAALLLSLAVGCNPSVETAQTGNANLQATPAASPAASPAEAQSVAEVTPAASPLATREAPSPSPSPSPAAARPSPSPSPSPAEASFDTAATRTLYRQQCASCHGRSGEGTPEGAPSLKGSSMAQGQIAKKIAVGGNGMPAYKGSLSPKQIQDLARLIRQGL